MSPAGAVLTGGASRRMGTDKALVEVGGAAMARRVADTLAAAGCDPVWCQGGDAPALAALGLQVRRDTRPGDGPLPAILDALRAAGNRGVVVAACDVVDLTPGLVAELVDGLVDGQLDGDVPAALAVGELPQLVSWWPSAAAPALADLIATGVRSYRHALVAFGARLVAVPALRNVNTPSDL